MLPDAPPVISVKGRSDLLDRPAVAVVGARNASIAGRRYARTLARELGEAGFAVVSGLARGIDTAAHVGRPGNRHPRGAGGRHRRRLSAGERGSPVRDFRTWPSGRGTEDRQASPGQALPHPEPAHFGPVARRRRGRGGVAVRLPDHRPLRARAGPRGIRRAGLAPRSALPRLQRAHSGRRRPRPIRERYRVRARPHDAIPPTPAAGPPAAGTPAPTPRGDAGSGRRTTRRLARPGGGRAESDSGDGRRAPPPLPFDSPGAFDHFARTRSGGSPASAPRKQGFPL